MTRIDSFFATKIYRSTVSGSFEAEIAAIARSLAEDDAAGQRWCEEHGYPGYTSYASLDDLAWRFPVFKTLEKALDGHVAAFAKELDFNLQGKKLALDSLWVNLLAPGGMHGSHLHPHSIVSGTYYVAVPKGASAIKFEDPRLAMMMAAPPRKAKARAELKPFVSIAPTPGTVLLWESWLRHEVPLNEAEEERISVSFNYRWG